MMHDFRRGFLTYANAVEIPVWTQKRLVNHAQPTDVTHGYVQFEMPVLRQAVEAIAGYILTHACIEVPPTSDGQPADDDQATPPEKSTDNVVNLDERRREKHARAA
jgi:hypothetical protein